MRTEVGVYTKHSCLKTGWLRVACAAWTLLCVPIPLLAEDEEIDYLRQVKPLLAEKCFACHGALKQEGGLRLDTAELAREGGDSGPAAIPHDVASSELIARVTASDESLRMPLEAGPLPAAEVQLLKSWIDKGAEGPEDEQPEQDPADHWAFQTPERPPVPNSSDLGEHAAWIRNPIDAFIAAQHQRQGLVPQSPADSRLLLRRVYLDLIGLPPTVEEMEAFAADPAEDAYDRIIAKLLKSPQHAERWGRHWMDIWRYSDWWGLGAEVRNSQKHIWHWRDWIIESLRDDVGYDEMLRQMLAADELYPEDLDKIRATGYLARQYFKFNRNTWLDETVEHTAKAFLGVTMNCCKCHDHKYDPFSHEDYYRFRAFFEPYQVRLEQLPGELDYEQNAIPRAYDCNLEAPTYLFFRGDEKQPRTSDPLAPGIPEILHPSELAIEPISLPPVAHHPGLRDYVLQNHLQQAAGELASAEQRLEEARLALDQLVAETSLREQAVEPEGDRGNTVSEATEITRDETERLGEDDFEQQNRELWKFGPGDWQYDGGQLVQQENQGQQGVATWKGRIPEDFEVRVNFTIQGGRMWKSVGLAFDGDVEHEILTYLSAYEGGSKLQVAFKQQGNYQYPPDATRPMRVSLGEPQELVLRVRGPLVNVEVNGEHCLAWRSPLPRLEQGELRLVTFDAQAAFSQFRLSRLASDVTLTEPPAVSAGSEAASSGPLTLEQARAALVHAEKNLDVAKRKAPTLQARAAADRARFVDDVLDESEDSAESFTGQAVLAERQLELATAESEVARLEFELLRAADDKRAEFEKQLASARQREEKARPLLNEPGSDYPALRGALKTIESTVETEENRLKPFPTVSTGRRRALAQWITSPDNPLAARVAVNHIWMRHFNQPLVPTTFDFGRKGTPPTHPELLDWLAVELMESGWSMRHLHRLIVTSATYRLGSSNLNADSQYERDPENRWYWRMNPHRMEAQVVRDSLLYLADELDTTFGGPSVNPLADEQSRRRSLYFVHSHNDHHRFLEIFDDAGVQECYRRDQSIVPQQSLALANSRQAFEAARAVTVRLEGQGKLANDDDFVRAVFLTLLANDPTEEELQVCREALIAWREAMSGGDPADSEHRARVNLVHALLNHNDFITIR